MPRATVDLTLALFVDLRGSSEMIEVWSQALEEKDPGTWSHCKRVAGFATALAQALRLDDKKIQVVAKGALLHEIGSLRFPKRSFGNLRN
jgi:cyclic di-GMP phosphodiesterase